MRSALHYFAKSLGALVILVACLVWLEGCKTPVAPTPPLSAINAPPMPPAASASTPRPRVAVVIVSQTNQYRHTFESLPVTTRTSTWNIWTNIPVRTNLLTTATSNGVTYSVVLSNVIGSYNTVLIGTSNSVVTNAGQQWVWKLSGTNYSLVALWPFGSSFTVTEPFDLTKPAVWYFQTPVYGR